MSSEQEQQAANMIGPKMGGISVMTITTGSTSLDLSLPTELGPKVDEGRFVTAVAQGAAVWFFLNNAATGTVDEASTTGNNRAFFLTDGGRIDFICTEGFHFVHAKGSAAGTLRMFLSSRPPHETR